MFLTHMVFNFLYIYIDIIKKCYRLWNRNNANSTVGLEFARVESKYKNIDLDISILSTGYTSVSWL